MNKVIVSFILFLFLLMSHFSYGGNWNCLKLFQKTPRNKLVFNMPIKTIEMLEQLSSGDFVKFHYDKKVLQGLVQSISLNKITFNTEHGAEKTLNLKNIDQFQIIKKEKSVSQNRFQKLINMKKRENEYFSNNQQLRKQVSFLQGLSKNEMNSHNQKLAKSIEFLIYEKFNSNEIGFHFNLNGGQVIDYIGSGGIKASRAGDVGIQYGDRHAQLAPQTYFFRTSPEMSLYDIISMGNMKRIREKSGRMGSVVNMFQADHVFFQEGLQSGEIQDTGISYIFSEKWLKRKSRLEIGVPYSSYIMEPIEIYEYKKYGFKGLKREIIDFLALKQIEFYIKNK